jgi:hypothetical protein
MSNSLTKFSAPFLFSIIFLFGCIAQPPIQEMSDARQSLSALLVEGYGESEEHGREIQIAEMLLDIAEDHIRLGNFELAHQRAIESRNLLQRIHNDIHH